jgi:YgiT-type zinc finger domain-containing protein
MHGTRSGKATVTLERDGTTLVIKNVPAQVCSNCGEEYVAEEITARLLKAAEEAVRAGVKVDMREYVPVAAWQGAEKHPAEAIRGRTSVKKPHGKRWVDFQHPVSTARSPQGVAIQFTSFPLSS